MRDKNDEKLAAKLVVDRLLEAKDVSKLAFRGEEESDPTGENAFASYLIKNSGKESLDLVSCCIAFGRHC